MLDLFSIKSYEMSKETSMSIILNSLTQVIFDFTMIMAICEIKINFVNWFELEKFQRFFFVGLKYFL